jgi:hypothetical protein
MERKKNILWLPNTRITKKVDVMKIKYHNWFQVAIMATMVAFSSCSDDPTLYSDTDITGFKVRLGETVRELLFKQRFVVVPPQ